MNLLPTLIIYSFENEDGQCDADHLTFNPEKASEYAQENQLCAIAHKYKWEDCETFLDCTKIEDTATVVEDTATVAENAAPERDLQAAAEAYCDGGNLADAAKIAGMNIPKTKIALVEMGVTIRGRGRPKKG